MEWAQNQSTNWLHIPQRDVYLSKIDDQSIDQAILHWQIIQTAFSPSVSAVSVSEVSVSAVSRRSQVHTVLFWRVRVSQLTDGASYCSPWVWTSLTTFLSTSNTSNPLRAFVSKHLLLACAKAPATFRTVTNFFGDEEWPWGRRRHKRGGSRRDPER